MKRFWIQVHLGLGLTLGVVGILIGLSGSILVYDHEIDAWLNPQRYAVSGPKVALPYGDYLKSAAQALEGRARPQFLRMPEADGMPLVVFARAREAAGGGPGSVTRLYLDPLTGKVLDAAPGGGFVGWLHVFHENLTLREYNGREIVGLVGFAMLISSLSGIYLWWPARGRLRQSLLGARPGFTLSRNLHYLFGIYGALVLAMLSFTGIWLAYTEAGRSVVSLFSPVAPRNVQVPEAADGGKPIPLEDALKVAQALYPGVPLGGLGLPAGPRGAYRFNFATAGSTVPVSQAAVFVDPRSGKVLRNNDPAARSAGDKFLVLQRLLHEGSVLGPAGRALLFVAGLLPALFVVTGTLMWLQKRRSAKS